MDVGRTEGELKAQKVAEAKSDSKVNRPQDGDSVAIDLFPLFRPHVDALYTTDRLSQKEIDGLNKFYEKNMSAGSGRDVIQDHLQKADFVPVDFRVLTSANQKVFMDYIKTLPKAQQDKVIIMR
ncbi:hypothetical protein [Pectobacterium brasiliense]|uniref:hypothetical protein n=1 Tax=Pectobacterium brasiliense TaxID=180957 RepID=UPI000C1C14AA|nr:hypothetical protein [Pectobacterium brasiliense]ATV42516.1 hypothetical protein CTV95_03190 [Pectobacterium brasiliense]MCA6983354.1 hypothetical protein [Pectobacterium brasiliense]